MRAPSPWAASGCSRRTGPGRALPALIALLALLALGGCATRREPTPELRRLAGQMLLVGFRGAEPNAASPDSGGQPLPILRQIPELGLGGVILFDRDAALGSRGRNIQNPDQLSRLTAALQASARAAGLPPLFVAVDQEGGKVQRLSAANGFASTPAPTELCPGGDPAPALNAGVATGRMLHAAGFNLDFAPVCDVNVNAANPVIGRLGRSFSSDPLQAGTCAAAFARGLKSQGVLTAAKHFPGHGSSRADSHLGFTDVSETWGESELLPFAMLMDQGLADMVMTAHVFNARLDPKHPASLSRAVVTGLLRQRLGFQGVVVTDDLQMRAVSGGYGLKEALGLAVNAGADVLLIGNNLEYQEAAPALALDALMALVAEGTVSEARIRESAARIQALKARLAEPEAAR